MMKSKILTISFIVSVAILISGIIQNNAIAYPQQKQGYSHNKMLMQPGLYAFGTIASLQNDENGNPTWIVSGIWKGSLSMGNETQGVGAIKPIPHLLLQTQHPQQAVLQMQHLIPNSIWL